MNNDLLDRISVRLTFRGDSGIVRAQTACRHGAFMVALNPGLRFIPWVALR
jgi:hypothetical protein